MGHPIVHARNSARKFGGKMEDYLEIHEWFDEIKAWIPDMRHRALRHHSEGIFECENVFGGAIINSDNKEVYTRYIGEQHVIEDLGFIPKAIDYFENMELSNWMMNRDIEVRRTVKNKIKKNNKLPKTMRDGVVNV